MATQLDTGEALAQMCGIDSITGKSKTVTINNDSVKMVDSSVASGINRSRQISVVTGVPPVGDATNAVVLANPGRGIVIEGLLLTAGVLTPAAGTNLNVRWSLAGTQIQAAIDLPAAYPGVSPTADLGETGSFMLDILDIGVVYILKLPHPIEIGVAAGIVRLSMTHNLTGLTLQFGVRALEEV